MKIAPINNLSLVKVAMQRLTGRQDGLPGLGVYFGPSGFGKTTTTIAVANETRAYYVQMRSAWSKKTFMEKICFEMGLPIGKTVAGCLDLICEQMAASQRPLIIDEADYAVTKAGMIELIRDIYEGSQAPVLLVGEEQLPRKLKKFERFHGRVLTWVPAQPIDHADAVLLTEIYAPGLSIDDEVYQYLLSIAHGSVRRVTVNLVNIYENSLVTGDEQITMGNLDKSLVYMGEAPKRGVAV